MKGFSVYPYSEAFAQAEAYVDKARDKWRGRPIANNTRLVRVDADTIAVVLHSTAVVTYHRSGEFTIYGGGWNTVTTKARIREFSPVRVSSDGQGGWIVGYTGEYTAPRVQKCRTCNGRGRWMEDDYCYGPGWHRKRCEGARLSWPDGYSSPAITTPCEHGRMETGSHPVEPCEHGEMERHRTGESERTCHRCKGEGRVDYGSKPIPVTVSASQAYRVDAAGTYLGNVDSPSHYSSASYKSKPAPPVHTYGSSLVDSLKSVIPNVRATVVHPTTGTEMPLSEAIVNLNDAQRWSRERIADWLETLDLDLRFPVK